MKVTIMIEDDPSQPATVVSRIIEHPSEALVTDLARTAWREQRSLKRISERDGRWEVILVESPPEVRAEMLRRLRVAAKLTALEAEERIAAAPGPLLRTDSEWLADRVAHLLEEVGAAVEVRRSQPSSGGSK